jgi:hypothetical protein
MTLYDRRRELLDFNLKHSKNHSFKIEKKTTKEDSKIQVHDSLPLISVIFLKLKY